MATNKTTGMTVEVGNSITVAAQGIRVSGEVAVVYHWGDDYGWDIEITKANVPGGYSRWKQIDDGGEIVELNGTAYEGEVPKSMKYRFSDNRKQIIVKTMGKVNVQLDVKRIDGDKIILRERDGSEHYLKVVLAYLPDKHEFVTWVLNTDFSGYNYGNYFSADNHSRASDDFYGRG